MENEMQDYLELAVVEDTKTGLFHGAVYRKAFTPGGCDSWRLAVTLNEGFLSVRKATLAINAAFPEVKPLTVPEASEDDDLPVDMTLPAGALVTHMIPNKKRLGPDVPQVVEVRRYNAYNAPLLPITLTPRQMQRMISLGHLVHDCSSGDDPELSYRYEHYLAMPDLCAHDLSDANAARR